jgi:hypothetical protein
MNERRVELPSLRGQERPAARRGRAHARPAVALAHPLPHGQQRLGILAPGDSDERLDRVRYVNDVGQPGVDRGRAPKALGDWP